jgi:hypothetical protein
MVTPVDKPLAQELAYATSNDGTLYRQMMQPVMKNLALKKIKGTYDGALAVKAWTNVIDAFLSAYRKKYGRYSGDFPSTIDGATKSLAGKILMGEYEEEFKETVAGLKAEKAAKEAAKKKTAKTAKKTARK